MGNLVSVIMSVYNEKNEWLRESIESILNQTYSNLEFIIVVDNPNCGRIIELLQEYQADDSRIKIIINENNMGLVSSLNKALNYCNGYYIARMDADDISLKIRLEKEIYYLEKNELDCVMSYMDKIDEMGNEVNIANGVTNIENDDFREMMKYCNIATHPTWLLKNDVYKSLNGYRNISKCEDYDFMLRALQKKFRIGKIGEVLLKYRIRSNSISQSNVLEQYLNAKYLRKCYYENIQIQEIDKHQIENEYENLDDRRLNLFNKNYLFLKKHNLFKIVGGLLFDGMFRDYFLYNLKLIFIMRRYMRGKE